MKLKKNWTLTERRASKNPERGCTNTKGGYANLLVHNFFINMKVLPKGGGVTGEAPIEFSVTHKVDNFVCYGKTGM